MSKTQRVHKGVREWADKIFEDERKYQEGLNDLMEMLDDLADERLQAWQLHDDCDESEEGSVGFGGEANE